MGQVISLLETGDMHAHDRAAYNQNLRREAAQGSWQAQNQMRQEYYGADRLGGGPLGTGYNMPQPRMGEGTVTVNVPHDRRSTQCAGAVAAGAGGGFATGAAAGNAMANGVCNGLPHPAAKGACRAGSSALGGAMGGYKGAQEGFNSPFCTK